ncbi:AAA family ATPase [Candidatus Woesearchaeota archaeon]|nr:AAA family ATPase [Candidatus Woesearchaeota archaeon]
MDAEIKKLTVQAEKHSKELVTVLDEVKKIIVGQEDVLERLLIAMVADGHILLEGVPGLAKTLMIRTLSDTTHSKFCRIQFTPDLLPADIIGTKIYDHKKASFYTKKGPIFANFILADEINRAPPKVQSALLEAMQERQVTIQGETFPLDKPFLVMATQNPIETEGTYKLPEAQVDRFMFKLLIRYPEIGHEKEIIQRMTRGLEHSVKKVLTPEKIKQLQKFCTQIYADEKIEEYVARLVDATRHPDRYKLDIDGHIEYGASPRASIWLILAGKAHALMNGRGYVTPEDIQAVAHDVMRHRILLSYEAEAEDITADQIVDKVLAKVKVP